MYTKRGNSRRTSDDDGWVELEGDRVVRVGEFERLRASAVGLGLFVARLGVHEFDLVVLVAWFLGYYLGDPVLDWILRVPHLVASIQSAQSIWLMEQQKRPTYAEFEAHNYLTKEDCKALLRIMYPRCRNVLRDYKLVNRVWEMHGAAVSVFPAVGHKILGYQRRCPACAHYHPLRLLTTSE